MWRASEKLELVHSDSRDPINVPSLNGSKYYLSFIDDKIGFFQLYFLKQKLELFGCFVKFKASIENQFGNTIKVFRTDNGGEYVADEFEENLRKLEKKHQFTILYNPQQNGAIKRKN